MRPVVTHNTRPRPDTHTLTPPTRCCNLRVLQTHVDNSGDVVDRGSLAARACATIPGDGRTKARGGPAPRLGVRIGGGRAATIIPGGGGRTAARSGPAETGGAPGDRGGPAEAEPGSRPAGVAGHGDRQEPGCGLPPLGGRRRAHDPPPLARLLDHVHRLWGAACPGAGAQLPGQR